MEEKLNDIIKALTKKDLLLLSAYVDSTGKMLEVIHRRFNNKLEKEFHENVGEDITRHRLRYFEVIGLLKSELKRPGRTKGKGINIHFKSNFSDKELAEILQKLGISIERDLSYKEVNKEESHNEAVEKLNLLLEKDEGSKKDGWQYLIKKK